jgi:hypothetical protein
LAALTVTRARRARSTYDRAALDVEVEVLLQSRAAPLGDEIERHVGVRDRRLERLARGDLARDLLAGSRSELRVDHAHDRARRLLLRSEELGEIVRERIRRVGLVEDPRKRQREPGVEEIVDERRPSRAGAGPARGAASDSAVATNAREWIAIP